MGEITEDDIRVGSTADVKWTRKGVDDVFEAQLLKTRIQKGQLQYKVHYKNWNKRYDEWISIDRVMRIYDDEGTLVKSRLSSSEGSEKSASPEDSGEEKRVTRGASTKTRKQTRTKSVLEAIESSSDEENGEEEDDLNESAETVSGEQDSEEKPKSCINCDKPAQDASRYCSVDCILICTKKAKKEEAKKSEIEPDEELSPPPLEPGDPDQEDDDEEEHQSDSGDDFVPPEDAKTPVKGKRGRPKKAEGAAAAKKTQKKSKSVEKEKKKPKVLVKMSDEEIDRIMQENAHLKDSDPIIVLKHGHLLTGHNAPKKSNLREFLEENRIGIRVVPPKTKPKKEEIAKIDEKEKERLQRRKEKLKLKYEAAKSEAEKIVIKEGSNAYSAREQKVYTETEEERKARREKRKKEKLLAKAFPEEAKKKQEKKKGQVSDETLDLMRAIKARRTEKAEQEKVKEEKEKKEKRREEKERRKSDSDRKRIGSASNNPETPTKKSRRESLPGTPGSIDRNKHEDPRSTIRKKLREILTHRSASSATNGTEKLVMNTESIAKLVSKIEKEMYKSFGEVNSNYKNKFRQIQFNLREPKNDYFWRRVITGEISASTMHKMTANDMATVEMVNERDKQQKAALEQVLKIEEQKQKEAARPTAKITHKGEIEIERFDETVNRSELEITNSSLNVTSERAPSPKMPETKKEDSPKKKADRPIEKMSDVEMKTIEKMMKATDRRQSNGSSYEPPMEWDTENGDEDLPEAKTPEYVFNPEEIEEPVEEMSTTPPFKEIDFVEREDPATADEPNSPENSPGTEIKQPDESSTNSMSKVWTGRINFTEGQKVHANGYVIGGKIDKKLIRRGLPKELRVAGSLTFNDAGKYINEIRQASDPSRICVMALYGLTASEQDDYREALIFLSERVKCGVVKCPSTNEVFKDLYIVPLKDDEELPNWLTPMNGPGLDDDHPAIFLLVMVKRSDRNRKRPEKEKHRSRERTSSSRSHHSDKTDDSEPIVSSGAPVLPISEENFENIKETLKLLNPASLAAPDSPVASNHELQAPHDWNTAVPPPINHPPPPHPRNHTADPYYNDHPPPPHQPSRDFDMRSKPYDGPPPPPHRHYDDRGWDRRGPPPPNDYYRDDRRGYDRGPPPRGWHDHGPYRGGGRGRGGHRGYHRGHPRDY